MSVSIQPDHTKVGIPQWHHTPGSETVYGFAVGPASTLILSDGSEYRVNLDDSVWRTVMEDLQEHFRKVDAQAAVEVPIEVPAS